jgi:hypothetical protein
MNHRLTLMAAVSILLFLQQVSTAQEWRGIRPMRSTCEDVKRILNTKSCQPPDNTYDLDDEKVKITFTNSRCHKAFQRAWNVPIGTVIYVERLLKRPIPIKDFEIDENNYERVLTDFTDQTILVSEIDGLSFSLINGLVNRVTYMPKRQDHTLQCGESPTPAEELHANIFVPWFDRYGNMQLY